MIIQENDVLCGRGGATNNHVGNKRFRALVADHQPEYLAAKKRDKSVIARLIVKIVRERGGRFLKKLEDTQREKWVDIGDKKAGEKTSQALREGLDVRTKSPKMPRRESGESSSSSVGAAAPPKKKRRQHAPSTTSPDTQIGSSPALVSELGTPQTFPALQPEEEYDSSGAQFEFDPPKVSTADCSNVVEV